MQTGHAAGGQRLGCLLHGYHCRQDQRRQAARLSDQRAPLRVRVSEDPCWGAQACKRPMVPIGSTSTMGFRLCCSHSAKPQLSWKQMQTHLLQPPTSLHRGEAVAQRPDSSKSSSLVNALPKISFKPTNFHRQLAPPKSKPPSPFPGLLHWVPHCSPALSSSRPPLQKLALHKQLA